MIKAITFDLWDTVFIDDSDEPKRKAAGRPTKAEERRMLVHQFIERHQPIGKEIVNYVYNGIDAAFSKVWHELHVTWSVRERLDLILKGLKRDLPGTKMNELIRLHEEMELEFRPEVVKDFHAAIKALKKNYKLGVISDTIFSPGRALRQLLQDEGLLDFFDVFIFSDEIGHAKPAPEVFQAAIQALLVEPNEIVHIGDRESNDICGPHQSGMKAVLCTAILDRGSNHTQADAKFNAYKFFPGAIERLNGND